MKFKFKLLLLLFSVTFVGCTTIPEGVLKLQPQTLEQRQIQTRKYDTNDEELILSASAGVLQDLGFSIDESETKLGLIFASKDRDATNSAQVAIAIAADIMAAMAGTYSNAYQSTDAVQKIRASIVSNPSLANNGIIVRVTFQRIVWNHAGNVSRLETLDDLELYEGFFQRLAKSVFLEAHKI